MVAHPGLLKTLRRLGLEHFDSDLLRRACAHLGSRPASPVRTAFREFAW